MTTGMDDLENVLLTTEELLASLVPEEQELALDNLLDYPREMVERIIFEREDYWTKLLTSEDRTAMLDYIREICFALGWQLYSDEDISLMPENLRKPISLQILMEYCQGIFQRLSRLIVLIDQSPNRQLTRERVWVDFSMTKKAGVGSINWLMSHPRSHRFEKVAPDSPIAPTLKNLFTQADENGEETSYLPTQPFGNAGLHRLQHLCKPFRPPLPDQDAQGHEYAIEPGRQTGRGWGTVRGRHAHVADHRAASI